MRKMELQLYIPPQEVTTVYEFNYQMDGRTTGKLYLMESSEHGNLCALRSAETGLETPWHGTWSGNPSERSRMLMHFDYKGRPHQASFNWAQVQYRQQWGEFQGDDYMNRRIQMTNLATWTLP